MGEEGGLAAEGPVEGGDLAAVRDVEGAAGGVGGEGGGGVAAVEGQKERFLEVEGFQLRRVGEGIDEEGFYAVEF